MHRAFVCLLLVACGHPAPQVAQAPRRVPRLAAPPLLDPDVRGSTYLASVALQLQPGWGQFLDDCRLRLPADHALNDMSLAAVADLAIDARGRVVDVKVATSGNVEFDKAVDDAVRDANPLPAPPRALWSDDDRVHLRWTFARDRRQAGPATAEVVDVQLPLPGVVARLVRDGDLTRAARRIVRAKPSAERDAVMRTFAVAALREALGSSDSTVRRSAVSAIARAGLVELVPDVRTLLTSTSDIELRLIAISAVATLGDEHAADDLLGELQRDVVEHERLAHAEVQALVALHHEAQAATFLRGLLDHAAQPNPIALSAVQLVALPELTQQITTWLVHGDARVRAAACTALGSLAPKQANPWFVKGLADRDARVRAGCLDAIHDITRVRAKVVALVKDRDESVRARAVHLVPDAVRLDDIQRDPSPQVRAAYAAAIDSPELQQDPDPDVRAAAWSRHRELAGDKHAAGPFAQDPAPQVRIAVLGFVEDDEIIGNLARADEDGDVRTAALVRLASRRGRDAMIEPLLTTFATAAPGTVERVRTVLAWLLAR